MLGFFLSIGVFIGYLGYSIPSKPLFLSGLFIVLYGCTTTVGWLLSRYVIPGNRIEIASKCINELNLKGDETVLDVGSGRGLYAIEAAKKLIHGHVFGIDLWDPNQAGAVTFQHKYSRPSGNSILNAKRNAEIEGVAHKITFINMDAMNIKFEKNKFDVVICAFIFSHLWRYKSTLFKNILSVLKPNGKLIIIDNYVCLTYILLSTPHLYIYSLLRKTKATYLNIDNWINCILAHNIRLLNIKAKRGILTVIGQQTNE